MRETPFTFALWESPDFLRTSPFGKTSYLNDFKCVVQVTISRSANLAVRYLDYAPCALPELDAPAMVKVADKVMLFRRHMDTFEVDCILV